jgi:squalene-hopene/tetraprenyl-beta-curcumene cyclase
LRTSGFVDLAIEQTVNWFLEQQFSDGHWRGPLEGDTILESEYLLICGWAGRLDEPAVAGCGARILREQLPAGGWAIYPGGEVDPSASVKAYLALKMLGYDPESEPLQRARRAIAAAGGPWAVNSFTRFYLALLGQIPYAACPAVPPEMILLPDWFPVSLQRVSAWSRTMIVPLSLIWAFKPVQHLRPEQGIGELFADLPDSGRVPPIGGTDGWSRVFRGVDRVLKVVDGFGVRPLPFPAERLRCPRRVSDRAQSGSIQPSDIQSVHRVAANTPPPPGCHPHTPAPGARQCSRRWEGRLPRGHRWR